MPRWLQQGGAKRGLHALHGGTRSCIRSPGASAWPAAPLRDHDIWAAAVERATRAQLAAEQAHIVSKQGEHVSGRPACPQPPPAWRPPLSCLLAAALGLYRSLNMPLCSIICALFSFGTAAPLPPPPPPPLPPPFAQAPLPPGPLHPQSVAAMEDLSSLRLSLGVRSVRTAPGQAAPPEDEGLGAPSLAQEIYRKYAGKTQPESRQLVAILGAVQVRGAGRGGPAHA